MRYDPQWPTAVFLGPSLDLATARARLPANYYPPVRMGDIYRLLATGVRTIAIIDGVFHQTTPVWQREILSALEEGIEVVGGASMGALRAAELSPFGMRGIGRIHAWYRDGVIDGDDEVALLHADHTLGYRALSEPLVNMRHNLARARARGLLDATSEQCLLAEMAAQCFTARSWKSLMAGLAWQTLDAPARAALAAFIAADFEDLKQADALAVIAWCADPARDIAPPPPTSAWSYPGTTRHGLQCALAGDGELVSAGDVLGVVAADPAWTERSLRAGSCRHFLLDWLRLHARDPRAVARAPGQPSQEAAPPPLSWLRANGITAQEWATEHHARASVAWLLAQEPETLGLAFGAHRAALPALSEAEGSEPAAAALALRTACLLADWARRQGITCPPEIAASAVLNWERSYGLDHEPARSTWLQRHHLRAADYHTVLAERALADWLLEQEPAHFGHEHWSGPLCLLRELQFEGRAAALVEQVARRRALPDEARRA